MKIAECIFNVLSKLTWAIHLILKQVFQNLTSIHIEKKVNIYQVKLQKVKTNYMKWLTWARLNSLRNMAKCPLSSSGSSRSLRLCRDHTIPTSPSCRNTRMPGHQQYQSSHCYHMNALTLGSLMTVIIALLTVFTAI